MNKITFTSLLATLLLGACGPSTVGQLMQTGQAQGLSACQAVQSHLQRNYAGWNSIGLTQDPAANCEVSVTYASAQDFLKYLQTSASRNESPLRLRTRTRAVNVLHEIIGTIVPQALPEGASGQNAVPFLTADEMDLCMTVKESFAASLGGDALNRLGINAVGIAGRPLNQCTIYVGFTSGAGYRKFVAERVQKGMNPTAHEITLNTNAGRRTVKMFIDAKEIGRIVPQ